MDSPDVVHPIDAALNEVLRQIADYTEDEERREEILGIMLTAPPFADWPEEFVEQLRDTVDYVRSLRRDLEQRQLEEMYGATGDGESDRRLPRCSTSIVNATHPI